MSAQRGRDLLLKVDATGSGTYTSVAGLRTRSISLGTETIDITNSESGGWRELLAGAGSRRAKLSGAGVFKDQPSDAAVQSLFFAALSSNWQIVVPTFGTIAGPFLITALEYAGTIDRELTFDITLESAGVLTFTAGA